VNLTGLVDGYYSYNNNHPSVGIGGTANEPFTFTNGNISLNLLELQLDKPVDKTTPLGFRVAVAWGQAINAVNNGNGDIASTLPGAAQYLKEGYFSYFAPVGKGLQLDVGKFVTSAGAEVIESNQNWNYSRSLLFYYGIPYYHMGLRAKYTFNDKWSATGFLVNGWNNVVGTNSGKTVGVSIGWNATKKVTLTETYLAGPRDLAHDGNNGPWNHLSDTVLAYTPNAKLSLQANLDYDRQEEFGPLNKPADYAGIAAYVKYQATPTVAVVGRYEYFNDHAGLATLNHLGSPVFIGSNTVGPHLNEFTGTVEKRVAGHLLTRLEYRHDGSNQDFFGSGKVANSVKDQSTVQAGLIFVLEPEPAK